MQSDLSLLEALHRRYVSLVQVDCSFCGRRFTAKSRKARYHNDACRTAAYVERKTGYRRKKEYDKYAD